MSETLLQVENLRTYFHTFRGVVKAVDGVSFSLDEGQVLGIVGESGSGKSVSSFSILKLIEPPGVVESDKILFRGEDISKKSEREMMKIRGKAISMVFQDPMTGTTATMQIDENLALAARRGQRRGLGWGISKKEKTQFHELLKTLDLGLEDRMTSKVGLLSGGQRQAVTLLMASLKKPKVLLLDEHTAALDPKTAAKVLALTDKIIEENHLTAMMVTHNMRDAIAHGNRLIMMNNGRVILNISGEEKKRLTVEDLLVKFEEVSGEEFDSDKALLG